MYLLRLNNLVNSLLLLAALLSSFKLGLQVSLVFVTSLFLFLHFLLVSLVVYLLYALVPTFITSVPAPLPASDPLPNQSRVAVDFRPFSHYIRRTT